MMRIKQPILALMVAGALALLDTGASGGWREIPNWPLFIDQVRGHVLDYVDKLPNFICQETVQRYAIFEAEPRWILAR